jgi:hypothetical protein
MSRIISEKQLERRRELYAPDTRVELVSMDDPCTNLKSGNRGTVMAADDIGTVFVDWDNGSGLGVAYGADQIKIVPTISQEIKSQILAVRSTAATNMFHVTNVIDIAEQCGFTELAEWLPDNKKLYTNFIFTGELELKNEKAN